MSKGDIIMKVKDLVRIHCDDCIKVHIEDDFDCVYESLLEDVPMRIQNFKISEIKVISETEMWIKLLNACI